MLLYRPRFRHPEKAATPTNLAAAQELSPILNFAAADPFDLEVDVETPTGEVLAIDDPLLARQLAGRAGDGHSLILLRSERAMTDCRPISLFSLQTARQLGEEFGAVLYKRRFRANVYLDLAPYDAIAAVADDLLVRLQADPQLARFWQHCGEDSLLRERQTLIDQFPVRVGSRPALLRRPRHEGFA
jgi:hypothetical protein